ncbi:DNA repair protein rad50 [Stygiomarasmius scandens]|uniref:DNA repair protein rad50 n=1 Tax=Marasmiellus scandens TaxID=2682957 RepID=A0ABR1K4I9_9AGAR
MASLNKLAIRGIRSFDDKQISVIEFFSPVTVIVGHNGSGKTTIIECLKYATTGDQPPNTRGGAFIHDPKMANEKEVKAQVKLRFNAANGTRMLAVRNLSVTAKKTTGLTMKTLESILALADGNADKGGKRGVISTKCAEMDTEIPQLLGVSKSVLENVIFCHQEDSYWPLAEPAALKKKFDDIFEATRYTKALDNIKALRKDRVAELKAEKTRLEGLAKEKAHADKLRSRITDLTSTIASKEIEYDEVKSQYDVVVERNRRLYDYSAQFREIYSTVGSLEQKKEGHKQDLAEAKLNLQPIEGTMEDLEKRLKGFNEHIAEQKTRRTREEGNKQDLEETLENAQKKNNRIIDERAHALAQAEAQQQRLKDREQLIKDISERHGIKNPGSQDASQVAEFILRLHEKTKNQQRALEKLETDRRSKQDQFNLKMKELASELEKQKASRDGFREQISRKKRAVAEAEDALDKCQTVPAELEAITEDIAEKNRRKEKLTGDIKNADYDARLSQIVDQRRLSEHKRDDLNAEFVALSSQSEVRAKLDLMRTDIKDKSNELSGIVKAANKKFYELVKKDTTAESFEEDIKNLEQDKEAVLSQSEKAASKATEELQKTKATLSTQQEQLKDLEKELKGLEERMATELYEATEFSTVDEAIKDFMSEINGLKEVIDNAGGAKVFENLLRAGKEAKKCTVCSRHLNNDEMRVFEKYLSEQIRKASPESIEEERKNLKDWEEELTRMQALKPIEVTRNQLKHVRIPKLHEKMEAQEKLIHEKSEAAEQTQEAVVRARKEQKDAQALKDLFKTFARLQKDITGLQQELGKLEKQLSSSGSTKTAGDVQSEMESLSSELRSLEKEYQNLTKERERHHQTIRNIESDLYDKLLEEKDLQGKLKEKQTYELQIEKWTNEIATLNANLKKAEANVADAQGPIAALESEYEEQQRELDEKISRASQDGQQLNLSKDKLDVIQKQIEKYVQQRRPQAVKEFDTKLEDSKAELKTLSNRLEECRKRISDIDKEINEGGSYLSNLRENQRVRKLEKQIADTQAEIDSYDLEEAAKAKRLFKEKWEPAKAEENRLQTKYSHIAGEISSYRTQLKTVEDDLKEFKDVVKNYTDQLIKVKMSDMANNDLEKYAKALDNAIMKYHTLKMEEVNDTMRHLWNKTYQGTDIDGIRIRSDVEGGASKRSYNYRVVMTKDQVEMDMRGRCSAGQKMLASIIIRLALSDSFGQNCGILALDEPTNALDTENIDALASSLVDIINERKNHANFQLIIITHDENFLRKLGQSDVMEYYWRVSRDARQKSVIERQRFR